MFTSSPASLASTWKGWGLRCDLLPVQRQGWVRGLPAGPASASQPSSRPRGQLTVLQEQLCLGRQWTPHPQHFWEMLRAEEELPTMPRWDPWLSTYSGMSEPQN